MAIWYIKISDTVSYKFGAPAHAYNNLGISNLTGVVAEKPAGTKATTIGVFADYPSIVKIGLRLESGKTVYRLCSTDKLDDALEDSGTPIPLKDGSDGILSYAYIARGYSVVR